MIPHQSIVQRIRRGVKKPDEKGVLGTGSCFTFRIGNLEKGGLLPLDSTEFKIQYVSGITDEGSHVESLYQ